MSVEERICITLPRRLVAEALGTCFLLAAVVGSGILGERLAAGNSAMALLANALATGAALFALIEWLAPLSGAHFNPLVTIAIALRGDVTGAAAAAYLPAQFIGAVIGVGIADAMFGVPIYALSDHVRAGPSQLLSEFVSTFGLIGVVLTCSRTRPSSLSGVVAAYIGAAFWFTATDFANPAVTVARAFTHTFSGIRLHDVPGLIGAEIAGTMAAILVFRWLLPGLGRISSAVEVAADRAPAAVATKGDGAAST
jgi:glycerol uptake facilitator-like aquaporin